MLQYYLASTSKLIFDCIIVHNEHKVPVRERCIWKIVGIILPISFRKIQRSKLPQATLLSGNFYNGLFRVSLKREKRIEKYTILYHPNSKELEFNKHYYSNHEILKVLKFFSNQLLQMWISSLIWCDFCTRWKDNHVKKTLINNSKMKMESGEYFWSQSAINFELYLLIRPQVWFKLKSSAFFLELIL